MASKKKHKHTFVVFINNNLVHLYHSTSISIKNSNSSDQNRFDQQWSVIFSCIARKNFRSNNEPSTALRVLFLALQWLYVDVLDLPCSLPGSSGRNPYNIITPTLTDTLIHKKRINLVSVTLKYNLPSNHFRTLLSTNCYKVTTCVPTNLRPVHPKRLHFGLC